MTISLIGHTCHVTMKGARPSMKEFAATEELHVDYFSALEWEILVSLPFTAIQSIHEYAWIVQANFQDKQWFCGLASAQNNFCRGQRSNFKMEILFILISEIEFCHFCIASYCFTQIIRQIIASNEPCVCEVCSRFDKVDHRLSVDGQ